MALIRIGRISLTTADADRLASFYRQAFGFEAMETEHYGGTDFARLTGIEGAQARSLPLRLGEETIELLAFTQRGAPYPADIGCDDPRFQHIAIVVADMETAYSDFPSAGARSIAARSRNSLMPSLVRWSR
jgi:catechol 2,3-dioxygenase-like lactoylglutathione lyase family enzyme